MKPRSSIHRNHCSVDEENPCGCVWGDHHQKSSFYRNHPIVNHSVYIYIYAHVYTYMYILYFRSFQQDPWAFSLDKTPPVPPKTKSAPKRSDPSGLGLLGSTRRAAEFESLTWRCWGESLDFSREELGRYHFYFYLFILNLTRVVVVTGWCFVVSFFLRDGVGVENCWCCKYLVKPGDRKDSQDIFTLTHFSPRPSQGIFVGGWHAYIYYCLYLLYVSVGCMCTGYVLRTSAQLRLGREKHKSYLCKQT